MAHDMDDMEFADDIVPDVLLALGIDPESDTGQMATTLSKKYDGIDGTALARSHDSIAGACVYIASVAVGDKKVSQLEVSREAGVSTVTIRNVYQEILGHERDDPDPVVQWPSA